MDKQSYLNEIGNDCIAKLSAIGIPVEKVKCFTINEKARRWGCCIWHPHGCIIDINSVLVDPHYEYGLRSTVSHELIHTCKDSMNHNRVWSAYANKANKTYGLMIQRLTSPEELRVPDSVYNKTRPVRYTFQCLKCGCILTRERACAFTRKYYLYNCPKCGGPLGKIKGEIK